MKYIYCLGDSITNGARNEYFKDFTFELNYHFRNKNVLFLKDSVNGETTSEILTRLIKLTVKSEIYCVIFIGGTNDTKIPIPIDEFKKNFETLICICKKFKIKLITSTLPKIYSGLPCYSKNNGNKFIIKYNDLIKSISKKSKINYIDLYNIPSRYMIDGIHSNNNGCKYIAHKLIKILNKNEYSIR